MITYQEDARPFGKSHCSPSPLPKLSNYLFFPHRDFDALVAEVVVLQKLQPEMFPPSLGREYQATQSARPCLFSPESQPSLILHRSSRGCPKTYFYYFKLLLKFLRALMALTGLYLLSLNEAKTLMDLFLQQEEMLKHNLENFTNARPLGKMV